MDEMYLEFEGACYHPRLARLAQLDAALMDCQYKLYGLDKTQHTPQKVRCVWRRRSAIIRGDKRILFVLRLGHEPLRSDGARIILEFAHLLVEVFLEGVFDNPSARALQLVFVQINEQG